MPLVLEGRRLDEDEVGRSRDEQGLGDPTLSNDAPRISSVDEAPSTWEEKKHRNSRTQVLASSDTEGRMSSVYTASADREKLSNDWFHTNCKLEGRSFFVLVELP